MNKQDLYQTVEHTLLRADAQELEIYQAVSEASIWGCRAVCLPPAHVPVALEYRDHHQLSTPIVSVAGFPLGYQSSRVKWTEIKELHALGVDEIDVVAPLYLAKAGAWDQVDLEIGMYMAAAQGTPVKVILETALLSDEEIISYCEILNKHQVQFAKTSTGFASGGATVEAVKLLREHLDPSVKIKASGGIRTQAEMEALLNAGADVLGMSKVNEALEEA